MAEENSMTFKLAKSVLLSNLQRSGARDVTLRQADAHLLHEHRAWAYSQEQLEQRFNSKQCQAAYNLTLSLEQMRRHAAHLDLFALLAADQSLADDDFVFVCEEGSLLASNWHEQIQDMLYVAGQHEYVKEQLQVIQVGDYKKNSFQTQDPNDYAQLQVEVTDANILSLSYAPFTKERQELSAYFQQRLQARSAYGQAANRYPLMHLQQGQLKAEQSVNINGQAYLSVVELNRPIRLLFTTRIFVTNLHAYVIRMAAVRSYVQQIARPELLAQIVASLQALQEAAAPYARYTGDAGFLDEQFWQQSSLQAPPFWYKEQVYWPLELWNHAFTFNMGTIAVSDMPLVISNYRHGDVVFSYESMADLLWSQTHQIRVQEQSLGYNHLATVPKFVIYEPEQGHYLQSFYSQPNTQDFEPLALESPSLPSHQALASAWNQVFHSEGVANIVTRKKDLATSVAFFRLAQSLLQEPHTRDHDYFLVVSVQVKLNPSWYELLNKHIQGAANLLPMHRLILGDIVDVEHFNLVADSHLVQVRQDYDRQMFLPQLPEAEVNYKANDFYGARLHSLVQLNNKTNNFILFSRAALTDLVEQLRQSLTELTPTKLNELAAQEFASLQQLEQILVERHEEIDEDAVPTANDLYQLGTNYQATNKISYVAHQATQNWLEQQGIAQEDIALWHYLHSLFVLREKVLQKNDSVLIDNHGQAARLFKVEELTPAQVLSLVAPITNLGFNQLGKIAKFESHSILLSNPVLAVKNKELTSLDLQHNEQQFALGERQYIRRNRRQDRHLRYLENNQQQLPDYLAKVRKFLISLPQATDRQTAFYAQEHCADFILSPAVYGKELTPEQRVARFDDASFMRIYQRGAAAGEVGCTLSHLAIYQQVLADPTIADNDWVMVAEDDTHYHPNWYQRVNQLLHYFAQHPESDPKFIQLNNNALSTDQIPSYEVLEKISYFNFDAADLININDNLSYLSPHGVVSYGSSNYLFRKSMLRQHLFSNQVRPFWVADDFPRFFAFKPDEYIYAVPMLSYQDMENFESEIGKERDNVLQEQKRRRLEKPLYNAPTYTLQKIIVIQDQLSEEQIYEKFPDVTHIVKKADFIGKSDEELRAAYDLESFVAYYKREPSREEMLLAVMHQSAYKYIDTVVQDVHNYFFIFTDSVTPLASSKNTQKMLLNQLIHFFATRLDTRTEIIEFSNSFYSEKLAQVGEDPRRLPGHFNLEQELAEQGTSLVELPEADLAANTMGYLYSDYGLERDSWDKYYYLAQAEHSYKVNPYTQVFFSANKARTRAKAYAIFSYALKTRKLHQQKISWLYDDFPRLIQFHDRALAYTVPPFYLD